jgi:hypothetical protein
LENKNQKKKRKEKKRGEKILRKIVVKVHEPSTGVSLALKGLKFVEV